MRRTAPRAAAMALASVALVGLSGCGAASEPAALEPIPGTAPADLCSLLPAADREGLETASSTDTSGNPTAACSLRSPDNTAGKVRIVVTWTQTSDEQTATQTWDSQCRAIDPTELAVQDGFTAEGADEACAGSGTPDGTDAASVAAVRGREVVTVRMSSAQRSSGAVLERARGILESVLAALGKAEQ